MEKHKKELILKCIIGAEILMIVVIGVVMIIGVVNHFIELSELPKPLPPAVRSVKIETFFHEEKFITQKEVGLIKVNDRILFGKVMVKWTNEKNKRDEDIAVLVIPYQEIPLGTRIEISSVEFLPNRIMPAYFYIVSKIHE